jgi:predicted phosphate transport protein (TIGR00153 family)
MTLNIFKFFQPKDKIFFLLFEKATANLIEISKALVEMVTTPSMERRKELIREIERLEHVGDDISHETFYELSANFITPFDREDIHSLISAIDDIADYVHGSSKRIELYRVETMSPAIIKLAELIEKSAQELHSAVVELKNMKNINKIKEACVRINSIENHADDIFDMAIAKLFDEEKDAIEIIKVKEVLYALETATDKCEDAANTIESILVKNA